jgi:hypothetical protein
MLISLFPSEFLVVAGLEHLRVIISLPINIHFLHRLMQLVPSSLHLLLSKLLVITSLQQLRVIATGLVLQPSHRGCLNLHLLPGKILMVTSLQEHRVIRPGSVCHSRLTLRKAERAGGVQLLLLILLLLLMMGGGQAGWAVWVWGGL